MTKTLNVLLHGHQAGQLIQKDDGRLSFAYDPAYLKLKDAAAISVAMPLAEAAYEHGPCHAVFGGMLPEGDVRSRLAKALGVSERNDFSLLAEIGGECAGAVSLWPLDRSKPKAATSKRRQLAAAELEALFKQLPTRPLLTGEGIRLSLAGAQNKLALAETEGHFFLPGEGEPSTHILKIAAAGYDGVLENEFFCMRLAKQLGLPAANVALGYAASVPYISVKRFDREAGNDGHVRRIHQEDFCQALGVAPENKYQNEGGPSLEAGVQLLREHSSRPAADIAAFLRLAYFNFLVGNADAHAKNYSILLTESGPQFAPAYDVLCTALYENLSAKMAMNISGKYDPERVTERHWTALAENCDLKPAFVLEALRDLAGQLQKAAPVLAEELSGKSEINKVFVKMLVVFKKRCAKVLA